MGKRSKFVALTFFCLSAAALAGCSGGGGGHKFEEHPAVAATCTTPGNKLYYTCSEEACKDKIFDENKKETTVEAITIAALGHDYDYEHKTVTWTAEGAHAEAKCTRCDAKDEETVSEEPNFYYVKDSDATCTEKEKGHWHAKFKNTKFGEADSEQVEVGPEPEGHDYGDLHPAAAPTRDEDGNIAYYQCAECGQYFDEEFNEISEEDIIVPNSVLSVDIEEDKSYALPDLSLDELLVIDIKIDEGSSFKFFLGDGWDNYIGNFEVKKTDNGLYTVTDNWVDGITYSTTEDGYFRMVIDYNHVEHGQHVDQMTKYDLIYIFGLGDGTTGKIMINPIEGLGGDITRGYKLNATDWVYLLPYTHTLDEYLTIDVKFISNDYNCTFCLYDDWAAQTSDIKLNPATGALVDQRNGVQVFKVEEAEGFVGDYYRIVINLAYVNDYKSGATDLTKVNRIAFRNNQCQAYVDVDSAFDIPHSTYYSYPCSTTEDTKIETKTPYFTAIQDGSGNYYCDKAIVINMKAAGGGAYVGENYDLQFSIQSAGWNNCGNIKLAFDNGAICQRIMQGGGCGGKTPDGSAVSNYCPKYTNNADGTCTLYIEIGKLNGDGWDETTEIGLLYDNPGINKNTVTSFAIDLDFQLIDVGDIPQL